ncbi:TldD/PmbA family protein, partial [bacterium]|nr:TldD/PmbA family protein [bacterium]
MKILQQAQDLISSHSGQVDYLEFRFENRTGLNISVYEKGIQGISSSDRVGGCVRACYRGGWGFASFSDLSRMKDLTLEAIEAARLIGHDKTFLAEVKPIVDQVGLDLKEDPRKISIDHKLEILQNYRNLMLSRKPEVVQAIGLSYKEEFITKHFLNSEGSLISQELLEMGLSYDARAVVDGEQTFMFDVKGSTNDFGFIRGLDSQVQDICDYVALYARAPKVRGGNYTVVLDPALAGVFAHESFGHTSEADLFAEKPGGLDTLRIGKRFGTEELNIYDTGLIPGRSGDFLYDDEGVQASHTDLIKDGILVGRMHNRETAARLGE